MSGSLKSYFYFVFWMGTAANSFPKCLETFCSVWNGEYVRQNFAIRAEDEAVMLVLGDVNTHTDHDDTSDVFI